jgi:hypothetical protein
MRSGGRSLTWARVFFWCAASSVLVGFWSMMRDPTVPASRRVPGAVFALAVFALYLGATLRAVGRLPRMPPAAAQQEVLTLAGVGLILAFLILTLR